MIIPWYLYALTASLILGIHYNFLSRAMGTISPITAYWLPTIIMIVGLPLFYKQVISDFKAVIVATPIVQISFVSLSFTSLASSYCLYKAIQSHNPLHVGLLEITYPIFIAIFGVLLFQQNNINSGTVIGGLLIMVGAGIVIYTNH